MFLCGEALRKFETFSGQIGYTANANLNQIVLWLGTYLFPVKNISKQNHMMLRRMSNIRALKVGCYASRMIELNEYLDFLGSNPNKKKCSDGTQWNTNR